MGKTKRLLLLLKSSFHNAMTMLRVMNEKVGMVIPLANLVTTMRPT